MRSGCAYGRLFRSSAFTNEKIAVFAPTERASVSTTVRVRSEEHTLNSSHGYISYAVFCLKKKNKQRPQHDFLESRPPKERDVKGDVRARQAARQRQRDRSHRPRQHDADRGGHAGAVRAMR